jgi:hypothetical protein
MDGANREDDWWRASLRNRGTSGFRVANERRKIGDRRFAAIGSILRSIREKRPTNAALNAIKAERLTVRGPTVSRLKGDARLREFEHGERRWRPRLCVAERGERRRCDDEDKDES